MPGATSSILANLAQLSPDSDKASVVAAIHKAVDDLMSQLTANADAVADPKFAEQAKQTILFLEACTASPDPEFIEQARRRMMELQGQLLSANDMESTPGDDPQSSPAEDTAAVDAPALAAPDVIPEAALLNFDEVFTDNLCKFVSDRLALFHISHPPDNLLERHDGKIPYTLSLEFTTVLEDVIRNKFAASILQSRNMKILASGINQEDMNEAYFMNFFDLPKQENVVRTLWGSQWDIVKAALHSQNGAQTECAQGLSGGRGKGKKSPLSRMFPKKEKAPSRPAAPPSGSDTAIGLEIWSTLNNNKGREFDPPKPEEIGLFDSLFDYKPGTINKRKIAVKQLLRQEVSDQEGREGPSRQYMSRMVMDLPPHCGELIALWAYYEHNDIFYPRVLKAYLASQATNVKDRKAALPLFLRWVDDPNGRDGE